MAEITSIKAISECGKKKMKTIIEVHKCLQCEQYFSKKNCLRYHMRTAHTHQYTCEKCGRTFKSVDSLRFHAYNHMAESCFTCDFANCDKVFKNPKLLSEHMRRMHNVKRQFMCEWCGYSTCIQCNFIVHRRKHTGEKPFCCDICSKCFPSRYQLNEHQLIHSKVRSSICQQCGAAFLCRKALHHHKTLHLTTKKFVCNLCDKTFAQAAGMAQHKRWHKFQFQRITATTQS